MRKIEQALLQLNERLTSRALGIWQGNTVVPSQYDIYRDFEGLLNPSSIRHMQEVGLQSRLRARVFHTLLGHYLQYRVFPYENELFTWMKGAAAQVNGEKIYFKDILAWCQKRSDLSGRRTLEKETSSLSKFLKPFALAFWDYFFELLENEFGYDNYVAYCKEKKRIDYQAFVPRLQELLNSTAELYSDSMEPWVQQSLGASLSELNRFDAIYLLGLGELDHLFPSHISLTQHLTFFQHWGIDVSSLSALHLDITYSPRKSFQAMSFALRIPQEVYSVMNPQGGWIDLETLFHEMGHALSGVFTSPDLSPAEKDFYTSNALSETYAFLLQNICFSPAFLERQLLLPPREIDKIIFYKALKDLSVFRRYAAKFLAEVRMFENKDLGNGEPYARLLKHYTGFAYRPETQLFDMAPELYSLDYVLSWMAEATIEKVLSQTLGADWMFKSEAGRILSEWWRSGNKYELDKFLEVNDLGSLDSLDLMNRWIRTISTPSTAKSFVGENYTSDV